MSEKTGAKHVILTGVHHGRADHGRGHVIYALLLDGKTGDIIISATLPYILKAVAERGYRFVKAVQP